MFYSHEDPSIRYTGRFGLYQGSMTTTAAGSMIEIAFSGREICLKFDIQGNELPYPHLYLQLDNGVKMETAVDSFLRIQTQEGSHYLKIIYKGGKEIQNRFYFPLQGKISFCGYEAEQSACLKPSTEKTVEFVGDSITEGVLIDASKRVDFELDQNNRPYQDDNTATYAALTAENMGWKAYMMGYGAVGVTHGGCGGVPKAAQAYPFCFDGVKVGYEHPDYIIINHGANDRGHSVEEYISEYRNLLDVIVKAHPQSEIVCVSAFCGCYPKDLEQLIQEYNKQNQKNIHFIDATLWVPKEPLHPLRDGHKILAEKLTEELKKLF